MEIMPHSTATPISVCQLGNFQQTLEQQAIEELDVMVALAVINLIIRQ
jgi:hypothetical protein